MLKQELLLLMYNKDIFCVIDIGEQPVCKTIVKSSRRTNISTTHVPVYDPYIPRTNPVFYLCPGNNCTKVTLRSITQLTSPKLNLNCCFFENVHECERIRFNHFKNIDKLLFLSRAIPDKIYFLVDCFVYSDGGRICHRNHGSNTHSMLVNLASVVRRNEGNILAQDEFLCEEDVNKEVLCDFNPYVPYESGLELKEFTKNTKNIFLKSDKYVIVLKYVCRGVWCGYTGIITQTRGDLRSRKRYEPPGGHVYRCFSANRQQVCKRLPYEGKYAYKERGWRSQ